MLELGLVLEMGLVLELGLELELGLHCLQVCYLNSALIANCPNLPPSAPSEKEVVLSLSSASGRLRRLMKQFSTNPR